MLPIMTWLAAFSEKRKRAGRNEDTEISAESPALLRAGKTLHNHTDSPSGPDSPGQHGHAPYDKGSDRPGLRAEGQAADSGLDRRPAGHLSGFGPAAAPEGVRPSGHLQRGTVQAAQGIPAASVPDPGNGPAQQERLRDIPYPGGRYQLYRLHSRGRDTGTDLLPVYGSRRGGRPGHHQPRPDPDRGPVCPCQIHPVGLSGPPVSADQ